MLLDDEDASEWVCIRTLTQKVLLQFGLNVSQSCMRSAIINQLNYSYKKVYFRSYDIDDTKVKETRFWLAFEMFERGYF